MSLLIKNQYNSNKIKKYSDFYFNGKLEHFIYIDTNGLNFKKAHPEFQKIMLEEFCQNKMKLSTQIK